jgi:pSer/pThr/pTyr-binding forkhead associated (FHA) protein
MSAAHDLGADVAARLAAARAQLHEPGDYLCFEEDRRLVVVALQEGRTRLGRSLVADVRFEDPTVSRRHALIVRRPGRVHLLDDRSHYGVFVNGVRVDSAPLADGDEITLGRRRMLFVTVAG